MDTADTKEYWRIKMFRDIATFIHDPSAGNKAKLMLLIDSYRYFHNDIRKKDGDHPLRSY